MAASTPAFYTGQLVLSVGGTKLAYAKSFSLSLSTDTIDTSSKMDGSWATQYPGKRSWTVSSDGLLATGYGSALKSAWQSGQLVTVSISGNKVTTNESTGATTMSDEASGVETSGNGLITSLEFSSAANDIAQFSISVAGSGPLGATASSGTSGS